VILPQQAMGTPSNFGATSSGGGAGRRFLGDGDRKAHETVGVALGGWRAGPVSFRIGWGLRYGCPGRSGALAEQPLVPRSAMGPGLGHELSLGLESVPRLARPGTGGLGTLGAPAAVGSASSATPVVGAAGSPDVESDRGRLGILQ
jgi:hypothetical protein